MKACPNIPPPTDTSSSKSKRENAAPETFVPSFNLSNALPALDLRGNAPSAPLKHHELYRLKGNEVGIIELAEDNRVGEERGSRTAEFGFRAGGMGITREKSVAEKVAIWESMWTAEQAGSDVPYFVSPHKS
ncbi:hypothetical protein HOY80DRAFT_1036901 [Tuber brumale]|nr:hypothetical protein HOY80DRAFT_1036901 [Tuber brumale]